MKKIVPIVSVMSLLGALISSLLLLQADIRFSYLFKTMILFVSAFICLVTIWRSHYNNLIIIISTISFIALGIILFNPNLYDQLWNSVLAIHLFLIGYTFYKESQLSANSLLKKITIASIVLTMGAFIITVLLKLEQEWIYSTLFTLFIITSILLIINKLLFLTKK